MCSYNSLDKFSLLTLGNQGVFHKLYGSLRAIDGFFKIPWSKSMWMTWRVCMSSLSAFSQMHNRGLIVRLMVAVHEQSFYSIPETKYTCTVCVANRKRNQVCMPIRPKIKTCCIALCDWPTNLKIYSQHFIFLYFFQPFFRFFFINEYKNMYFVCLNGIWMHKIKLFQNSHSCKTMDNYELKNIWMEWWRWKTEKYQPKEAGENKINKIWKISAQRGRQKKV